MAIYTRYGDAGMTKRIDGTPVRKDSPRVRAVGGVDELNSVLGLCICRARREELDELAAWLEPVQRELFAVGACVASVDTSRPTPLDVAPQAVDRLEGQIDSAWQRAGQLQHFILPAGCETACLLHVARTVCRRAERDLVTLAQEEAPSLPPLTLQYLNRLSDLLFAMARLANHAAGVAEVEWSRAMVGGMSRHG